MTDESNQQRRHADDEDIIIVTGKESRTTIKRKLAVRYQRNFAAVLLLGLTGGLSQAVDAAAS